MELVTVGPGNDRGDWVDEILLNGCDREVALVLGQEITRSELRMMVAERKSELAAAGLVAGGTVALRLPPSRAAIVNLLAVWGLGAQAQLLDYRLTDYEVDRALLRLAPQYLITSAGAVTGRLRGFHEVVPVLVAREQGLPSLGAHALLQLSSGSTGPSKIIGRTVPDLIAELERYFELESFPGEGETVLVMSSTAHVLGLVGGVLYGLYRHLRVTLPGRTTLDHAMRAIADAPSPVTVLGVPAQAAVLAAVQDPPRLPGLRRMITGGELLLPAVRTGFDRAFGVPLGIMYGMTETGMIATDLSGGTGSALTPAPGMTVREEDGQILVRTAQSPYVGLFDQSRWVDGWLHTRDAGSYDPETRQLRIRGRLDSQISIGGLKVDLTEAEQEIGTIPGVTAVVVLFDKVIEAYVSLSGTLTESELQNAIATRLAGYKRPRLLRILPELPRTASGKLIRDLTVLRDAAKSPEAVA